MKDLIVLCYHAVSPTWPAALSIRPELLESQLRLMVNRGYRGATLSGAISAPPGGRTVVITFDDAYRSVIERALPVLEPLGLPATVFAVTDSVGIESPMIWPEIEDWLGGPHEDELVPMAWPELERLRDAGWEVGSHTRSHPHLPAIADAELDAELAGSKAECTRRLGACDALAYPFGEHDDRVVDAARRAGYRAAVTLTSRPHPPTALSWPRVGVYHDDELNRFRLKVSPLVRRLRMKGQRPAAAGAPA